jgi:uncharacterized protein (DUF488 family)
MESEHPIITIGHSTRSVAEFADALRFARVSLVVDVRTVPKSRHNPQYNETALESELEPYQIGYTRIAGLGGLRGKSPDVPRDVNGLWRNDSFHNYADYALSDEFSAALAELIDLNRTRQCAIMCAEAVWWRCHRRIIADYLLARGDEVLHLMGRDRLDPARLTPGARVEGDRVIYPAAA